MRVWVEAARPKTLAAALAPVVLGAGLAWAEGGFMGSMTLLALLSAAAIQIGTNYYNDYADFKKGADTAERKGPPRATAMGWVSPSAMYRATIIAFTVAVLLGLPLIIRGGWPIAVIGFSGIAFGYLYTATRYSLAYLGIADLFVLAYFGPIAVAGTVYVNTLEWSMDAIWAGFGPGLFAVAILLVNNIRDVETDERSGKRTLVVRIGKQKAVRLLHATLGLSLVPPLLLMPLSTLGLLGAGLLVAIVIFGVVRSQRVLVDDRQAREANELLANIGQLLLGYSLLFASIMAFAT